MKRPSMASYLEKEVGGLATGGVRATTGFRTNSTIAPKLPVPKEKKRNCADCGEPIVRITTTSLPKRCSACQRKRDTKLANDRAAAKGRRPFIPQKSRAKPMPSRNEKRRPTGLGSAQREAVMERAGGRCEFEILQARFVFDGESHGMTYPCRSTDHLETVHVVRRHKCGDIAASPVVAIAGCKAHHDVFDGRALGLKPEVAEDARERCFLAIRHAEVRRIFSGRACVPVDLSEILPAGEWTVERQYELTDAARKAVKPQEESAA